MSRGRPHTADLRPHPEPAHRPHPTHPPQNYPEHLITYPNSVVATAPIWPLTHGRHPTKPLDFPALLDAHVNTPDLSACSDWPCSTSECTNRKQPGNSAFFVPEDCPNISRELRGRCEDVKEIQIKGQFSDASHNTKASDAAISFRNPGSSRNEGALTLGLGEPDEHYSDLLNVNGVNFNLGDHLDSGDDKTFGQLEPNCCFLVDDKVSCTDVCYSDLSQLTVRRRDTGKYIIKDVDRILSVSSTKTTAELRTGTAASRHRVTQTNQINVKGNERGGGCEEVGNSSTPACMEQVAKDCDDATGQCWNEEVTGQCWNEEVSGQCWNWATLELPGSLRSEQIERSANGSNRCHSPVDNFRSTSNSESSAMDNNNNGNTNNSVKGNGSSAETNKKVPGSSNIGDYHEVKSKCEQGHLVTTHAEEVGSGVTLRQLNSNRSSEEELDYSCPCLDNSGNSTSAQLPSDTSFNAIFFGDDPNGAKINKHTGTGPENAASRGSLHFDSRPDSANELSDLSFKPCDPRAACNSFVDSSLQEATCSLSLDGIDLAEITPAESGETTANNCCQAIEPLFLPFKNDLSVVDSLAHAQGTMSSVCSGNRLLSACTPSGASTVGNDVVHQTMEQQLCASQGRSVFDSHVTDNSETISLTRTESYVALDSLTNYVIHQSRQQHFSTLNEAGCSPSLPLAATSTCQQHDRNQQPIGYSASLGETPEPIGGENKEIENTNLLSSLNRSIEEYFHRIPDSADLVLSAKNEVSILRVPSDGTLLERLLKNMTVAVESMPELDWELPELGLVLPSWTSENHRKAIPLPEFDTAGNHKSDSPIQNSDATCKNQSNPLSDSMLALKQVSTIPTSRITQCRKVVAPSKTAADRQTSHSPGTTGRNSTRGDSRLCLCGLSLCGQHSQSGAQDCPDALLEPHILRIPKPGFYSSKSAGTHQDPTPSGQPPSGQEFQVDEFTSLQYATSLSCSCSGDQNIFSENVLSCRSSPELTKSDSRLHPCCASHPNHTVSGLGTTLTQENFELAVADPVVGDGSTQSRTVGKIDDSECYVRARILKAKERRRKLLQEMDEITSCTEAYHLPRYDGRWFYDTRCGRRELRHAYEKQSTEADFRQSSEEFLVVGTLTVENVHPPVDGLILSKWGH